ncbi:MAG: DUF1549 domain-containing protein [Planctomycetaceae bacterium]
MRCCILGCIVLFATPSFAAELLPADRPIPEVIDHYVNAHLKAEGVRPVGPANEATLLRRTMLDLIGRIPASVEVREYLKSRDPKKRAQLADRLMASPEYVEHQATTFDAFMSGGLRGYLLKALKENRSWDRMFRDLLLGGDPKDPMNREAANFLKSRVKDLDKLTNDVSVVFFGVNVSCAKCHDHPLVDDWQQDHFYGMKSFFNRTFASGNYIGERSYGQVSYKTTKGEARNAKLMFLTGSVVKEPKMKEPNAKERKRMEAEFKRLVRQKKQPPLPKFSRRKQLVEIALKKGENAFFAKAIVNRVWHQYMGYGLVMPLDQMHSANPPSHPQLMDWLARDFGEHGYDLRRLIKGIVLSGAYARSSAWTGKTRPDPSLFAVAAVKPLTPQQLARSLSLATADPVAFTDAKLKSEDRAKRIAQSASASNANVFEQPGENFQISADEALFFSNSPEVEKRYLNGGLVRRLETMTDAAAIAESAVWSVLCRPPTKDEVKLLSGYIAARKSRRPQAVRQVVWSLLTGSEFRFNY